MSIESRKSLLKNTLALSIPNALNPFVSLILVSVVSRKLGVEGMGEYSLLFSYLNIFTTVASLGLGGLLVREVARRPEDVGGLAANSLLFGVTSSVVALFLMDLGVSYLKYDSQLQLAFFVGSIFLIPASCGRFLESIFRAVERSEFIAIGQFVENISKVILCVAVVLAGYGIVAISAMTVLTKFAALGLLFWFYLKAIGGLTLTLKKDVWTLLVRESPTFMGIAIFSTIHLNIDMILLSKLASVSAVGIYGAATRIYQMCVIIPMAFSMAILPTLSRDFGQGLESLREKTQLSIRYIIIFALPTALGMFVLADKIIFLIYGGKFAQSVLILQLLAPCLVAYSLVLILAQTFIAANFQKIDLVINMVAALMSGVLNYELIQYLAEIGAVIANLVTMIVFLTIQIVAVNRILFLTDIMRIIRKPLIATVGMTVTTLAIRDVNVILNVLISVLVYFGLLFLLKGIYPEEIAGIKKLVVRSFHLIKS